MSGLTNREDLLGKLKQASEVNIAVTGRRTKKRFSTPVWFVLDEEKVVLVPMHGSDNEWFKNLEKGSRIELGVDRIAVQFKAKLIKNPQGVERVLDRFRAKYKSMWSESYYSKRDVYVEVPL